MNVGRPQRRPTSNHQDCEESYVPMEAFMAAFAACASFNPNTAMTFCVKP